MSVSVKKATLSDLDTLMEWRMRVLAEVFPTREREDRTTMNMAGIIIIQVSQIIPSTLFLRT